MISTIIACAGRLRWLYIAHYCKEAVIRTVISTIAMNILVYISCVLAAAEFAGKLLETFIIIYLDICILYQSYLIVHSNLTSGFTRII